MKNEARLLPRYIDSIQKHFGEIGKEISVVIVDTGSTDDSVQIARSAGIIVDEVGGRFTTVVDKSTAKHINQTLKVKACSIGDRIFNFGAARNYASTLAQTSWVLSMDICDFIVELDKDQLLKEILAATKDGDGSISFCLHYGTLETLRPSVQNTIKLYNRTIEGNEWRLPIHEYYKSNNKKHRMISPQTLTLRHAQLIERSGNKYLPHLAFAYFMINPSDIHDKWRLRFYLGRELYYYGLFGTTDGEGAKKILNEVVKSESNWRKERSSAAMMLANIARTDVRVKDRSFEERYKYTALAIKLDPCWREPFLKMSELCYDRSDWAGMVGYANLATKIQKPTEGAIFSEPAINYTTEPYRLLMLGYARLAYDGFLGRNDIEWMINKAIELQPLTGCDDKVFAYNYDVAHRFYQDRDPIKAHKYYELLHNINPERYKAPAE